MKLSPAIPRQPFNGFNNDNKEVYASTKHQMSYDEGKASLSISTSEIKDAGKYKFEAANKLGRVECQCLVTVKAPPTIEYDEKLKNIPSLKAGSSLILLVNISGMPTPSTKCFFGEEEIKPGVDTFIEGDGTYFRLTVKKVTGANGGKYKIVTENEVGSDSAEFNVTVIGEFSIAPD